MGGKQRSLVTQILTEGTTTERRLEREELMKEVRKLADKMPASEPDRLVFVRNLVMQALRGKIDFEVFRMFVKMTDSWIELETCLPRARRIVRERRGR